MKNTDLHIHTHYSDGCHSPKEVVDLAYKKKLKAIAIADHDNLFGSMEAKEYAKKIEVISGVEISSSKTEILGYFIDYDNTKLNNILFNIQKTKNKIVYEKIKQLQDINIDIEYEDVLEKVSDKSTVMTSHIAMALCDKQVCSVQEFYDKILPKTERPDLRKYDNLKITPYRTKEIIKTIIKAGGAPVLPHPWFLKQCSYEELESFLDKLVSYGLKGIEITGYVPEGFNDNKKIIDEVYKKYDLVACGGSDFHCLKYLKHNILGNYNISYDSVEMLRKKVK